MDNIELYYESIKQVYERILEWRNKPEPLSIRVIKVINGISIVLLMGSIIPVFPSILIFIGSRFNWVIFSYKLNES